MRPDIQAMAALEFRRAEMVEEDERSDRAPVRVRQRAPHREAIEVDRARNHHRFERVAGETVAGGRVLAGEKAHGAPPFAEAGCVLPYVGAVTWNVKQTCGKRNLHARNAAKQGLLPRT